MSKAWNGLCVDEVLFSTGNKILEEGLLVYHFLKVVRKSGTHPDRSVTVVTTHYAQMVWLRHCVAFVSECLYRGYYPILLEVATMDRFQGLQAQANLAFLVSVIHGS